MRFDDVVEMIRCPECAGSGVTASDSLCDQCQGTGINPNVVEEASGWGTWAISVHESPGWLVAVPLGLEDPFAIEIREELRTSSS